MVDPFSRLFFKKVKIFFGVEKNFAKNFSLLSLHSSRTLRKRNLTLSASIHNGRGRVDDDDDDDDFVLLVEKIAPEQTRGSGLGRAGVDDRVLFSEQV